MFIICTHKEWRLSFLPNGKLHHIIIHFFKCTFAVRICSRAKSDPMLDTSDINLLLDIQNVIYNGCLVFCVFFFYLSIFVFGFVKYSWMIYPLFVLLWDFFSFPNFFNFLIHLLVSFSSLFFFFDFFSLLHVISCIHSLILVCLFLFYPLYFIFRAPYIPLLRHSVEILLFFLLEVKTWIAAVLIINA